MNFHLAGPRQCRRCGGRKGTSIQDARCICCRAPPIHRTGGSGFVDDGRAPVWMTGRHRSGLIGRASFCMAAAGRQHDIMACGRRAPRRLPAERTEISWSRFACRRRTTTWQWGLRVPRRCVFFRRSGVFFDEVRRGFRRSAGFTASPRSGHDSPLQFF